MKTVIIIRQKTWVARSVVEALKSIGYFIDDILISDKWEPSFKQVLSRDTIVIVDDSANGVKICNKLRNLSLTNEWFNMIEIKQSDLEILMKTPQNQFPLHKHECVDF